ncbi:hypothetical protein DXG03_006075 [Asterophora parasitica]|uniref:Uncharacterized protein n=1 Tax=Asterophora parasitica TaxID=117018 RepID=A0A9P7KHV4_9AGAR|nr:hypothetical protein DXG03_006075 [Asterophora parasitica]
MANNNDKENTKEFPNEKAKTVTHETDTESLKDIHPRDEASGESKLVRQLKNRHIAMIRASPRVSRYGNDML